VKSMFCTPKRILVLSLISLLQFCAAYFFVLQHFANSGDEQSYLFQAELFAHGKLFVEDPLYDRAHPLNHYIAADAIDDIGGRRFSKYPPGWPALLALGFRVGAPWLVSPVLAAFTIYLLLSYVRRRMGEEYVDLTWWLLTLCPFFFLSVASYGSHTAAMAFLFAAFCLYDDASPQRFFFAGVLLGFSALIRYLDWIPLALLIAVELARTGKIKGLLSFGIGLSLLCSCHLLYNDLLSGNALISPTSLYAKGGLHDHLVASWRGFELTAIRLKRLVYALPPVLLLMLFFKSYWRREARRIYLALFALNVAIYFFYVGAVGGPGPRYLLPYFPFLVLAIVEGLRVRALDSRFVRRAGLAVLCAQVVLGCIYAVTQWRETYERKDLERSVARISAPKKILLLQTVTDKAELPDLIRNSPEIWSADTLYFTYDQNRALFDLLKRFPEHKVYLYRYPGAVTDWQ
jgi:hypothetical protein